jgi:hypothetical protein
MGKNSILNFIQINPTISMYRKLSILSATHIVWLISKEWTHQYVGKQWLCSEITK